MARTHSPNPKSVSVPVRMTDAEAAALDEIVRHRKTSRSEVIRSVIRAEHTKIVGKNQINIRGKDS